ncbi:RHS repeat-associated core domain-containing protein [uncultured Stenotrophomonas sp.]|uniref:RHS repeat-associated core domain-containing protein n=1 Tax=uncultured Stenotrophomonas sp. TaxID=165438 RepID=UPI0028D7D035|nr:RHS repeat-associated core domain-containing protein [uncultured Stenotrophomonas sp.]
MSTVLLCALIMCLAWVPSASAQTFTYYHTDPLGSVVAKTDESGNVIERIDYEPYGAVVGGQLKDGPGYTGHVSDAATGLSYMQQRYMDPQLGVFLSVDPVTAYQKPVDQFNRYRYANGSPYTYTDPDGRESGAAFRVVNNLTNGGSVSPPPRNPADKLGPAIGVALAGALAAPVVGYAGAAALANPTTTTAVIKGAADIAMGDAIGGASLGVASAGIVVNAERAAASLAGSTMQTTQKAVSLPAVQRYVDALISGSKAPAIQADGRVIVDGNHRYVAGRIFGQEPSVVPGSVSTSQLSEVRPVQELRFDPVDWGNH